MSELFEITATLSPKAVWIQKHDLNFYCSGKSEDFGGEPWNCWKGSLELAIEIGETYSGATPDDALVAWAKANNVRLWNEDDL